MPLILANFLTSFLKFLFRVRELLACLGQLLFKIVVLRFAYEGRASANQQEQPEGARGTHENR